MYMFSSVFPIMSEGILHFILKEGMAHEVLWVYKIIDCAYYSTCHIFRAFLIFFFEKGTNILSSSILKFYIYSLSTYYADSESFNKE